jgi:membrane dipeptidase
VRTTIDLHCDSVKFLQAGVDLKKPNPEGHVDLPRLEKGGVGVQTFAAFLAPTIPEAEAFDTTRKMLDAIDDFALSDPARLSKVETAADCRAAMESGRTGILPAVENGRAINDSLANLENLRSRGVRILTLVHSRHESWAASCTGKEGGPAGLTLFGKKVIAAMNEMGIVVDVSHSAESTFWDAVKTSRRPIVASHSCCHALCAAPRNLKDDQIRAVADSGGVIGVCFFPAFLDDGHRSAVNEKCGDIFEEIGKIEKDYGVEPGRLLSEYVRLNRRLAERLADYPVPLSRVADHIDHIVRLAGEDCVGFGSDFDGIFSLPDGVTGCDLYPDLIAVLGGRGYSGKALEKMRGENFLRVLAENDR